MAHTLFVIPYAGESVTRLAETVQSASAALRAAQDVSGGVMVVGDGEPVPEVDAMRFTCSKRGVAGVLNFGAQIAIEYGATHIARLDTGDTVHEFRLMQPLPDNKGQFCGAYVPQRRQHIGNSGKWAQRIWSDNQFCASSTIVPAAVWIAVQGYDETLTYCSDWDFHVRVHAAVGWVKVPQLLCVANEYADGLTARADKGERRRCQARVANRAREMRRRYAQG